MQDQLDGQQEQLFSYKHSVKDGSAWRITLLSGIFRDKQKDGATDGATAPTAQLR